MPLTFRVLAIPATIAAVHEVALTRRVECIIAIPKCACEFCPANSYGGQELFL